MTYYLLLALSKLVLLNSQIMLLTCSFFSLLISQRLYGTRHLSYDSCCKRLSRTPIDFLRFTGLPFCFNTSARFMILTNWTWVHVDSPQEPIRSSFCDSEDTVKDAYLDLLASSRKTLDSILELQEVQWEQLLYSHFSFGVTKD